MSATDVAGRVARAGKGLRGSIADLTPSIYRRHHYLTLVGVAVLGLLAPYVLGGDDYSDGVLNTVLIYAILTLGFYWCFSLAGAFTFAVAAVYGAGSYVSIWVANHAGGFWSGFFASIVACALIGAAMRLLFGRSSMIFFAIATMACGSLLTILFREWVGFTGGFAGVSKIAVPSFFGIVLDTQAKRYYLLLAVLLGLLLLTVLFLRSPAYRDLQLARDKGPVASVVGLRPRGLQLVVFTVGSGIQGAAGSLYAHNAGYVAVDAFSMDVALLVLLMLLLGGIGSIYGPMIGAAVLIYLPEYLRGIQKYSDLIYAAAVLFIVVAFPQGIAGLRATLQRRWAHRAASK